MKRISSSSMKSGDAIKSKYFRPVNKVKFEDFNQPCEKLSKYLLGKVLVREINDTTLLRGRIVETECYPGGEDRCSHSFQGKQTERNRAMFMDPGTLYVYMTYGMYHCMNISSQGDGAAVLIRALEPFEGLNFMQTQRLKNKKKIVSKALKTQHLCNGPAKSCQAFDINRTLNTENLCTSSKIWIEDAQTDVDFQIVECKRIGLNSKWTEWVNKPFRYYIFENNCVSVKNKEREQLMT